MAATDDIMIHEERQPPPAWAIAVAVLSLVASGVTIAATSAGAKGGPSTTLAPLGVTILVALMLATFMGGLRTRVTGGALVLQYGRWPAKPRIAGVDLLSAQAVTYSPMRDFGGWGIRYSMRHKGLKAWTGRGNRGVLVTARDGKRLLVGSDEPEVLAEALGQIGAEVLPPAGSLEETGG